jgi:hypothetical protein
LNSEFFQITLTPENGCDGPGLRGLLRQLAVVFPVAFVSLSDVDLIGDARSALLTPVDRVRTLPLEDFCSLLGKSSQIVWANVFLCQTQGQSESLLPTEDYTDSLLKAEALVRVVDAGSYYVYGPAKPMRILHHQIGGDASLRTLSELSFPE